MVGRSQLGSQGGCADPCNTRRSEGTAGRCGRKMKGKEKTARGAGLYTFEKAAGGAMPGALPEEAALNPIGRRLAWKQERASLF